MPGGCWLNICAATLPGVTFDENRTYAIAPTVTPVSRQALFAGRLPAAFADTISRTDQDAARWRAYWVNHDVPESRVAFQALNASAADLAPLQAIAESRNRRLGILLNLFDEVMHLTKDMPAGADKRVYYDTLRSHLRNGHIEQLFDLLLTTGYRVFVTADHGSIAGMGVGLTPPRALIETYARRVVIFDRPELAQEYAETHGLRYFRTKALPPDMHPVYLPGTDLFASTGCHPGFARRAFAGGVGRAVRGGQAMIGLDFPVKPAWIHDVLRLWQPDQPISDLVNAALAQTMTELGGEKTRRNSLTVILRYFVPTVGGGQTRRTTQSNLWAAYAAVHAAGTLAPAYLARIIARNDVAGEATRFISRRFEAGGSFESNELRRRIISQFGERKVVVNSANAFLRTLVHFGVLETGDKLGQYRFLARLQVTQQAFPLVVWAWWGAHPSPQIDLDLFAEDPALSFMATTDFPTYWRTYQPELWLLDERLEGKRATLRQAETDAFQEILSDVVYGSNRST